MPSLTTLFLACAGLLIGLQLLRFILVMHNLLRTRVQKPGMRLVPAEAVPAHVREGLQAPIAELVALGFEPRGWISAERCIYYTDDSLHLAWLFHPKEGAYASVSYAIALDSLNLYSVALRTFALQGPSVLTLNGVSHASLGAIPGTVLVDPYAATLENQWQAHRDAVARNILQPAPLTPEDAVERAAAQEVAQIDALIAGGRLVPAGNGTFQFSWIAAAALAVRMIAATRRVQDLRARRARALQPTATPLTLPPVEEEVAAYKRHDEMTRAPARRSFFLWLFAVSLALFAASFATSRDTAVYGAIVVGVVLFHELGHYAAMRAFGYQDTTIFFIPFLGGAAAGRKVNASLAQEIIVLLAGPVPGLILAAAAALSGATNVPQLNVALWMLVSVNLFNLLPILPLDGGRIVHALLFARNAWLDAALRIAGVALFALLAVGSSSAVLFGLTLLMALGIPHGFRLAALRRSFNGEIAKTPGESRIVLFFRMLHEKGHGAIPFPKKVMLARGVLLEASRSSAPRLRSVFLWLIAYAGSFLAGTVAIVALVLGGRPAKPPAEIARQWTPLAPLACPLDWHASSPAGPSGPHWAVTSIAVFEDQAGALGAKQAIQTTVAGASATALGRVLFLGADFDAPPDAEDDDAVDEKALAARYARAEESRSARIARMGQMVSERRGSVTQVQGDSRALVAIQCTARGVAEAREVEDDLSDYFTAGAGLGIRAPWTAELTASQRRARRTYRIASTAITASLSQSLRWATLRTLWTRWRKPLDRRESAARYRKEWEQPVRAAVNERRAIEPVDDEVATLSIAAFAFDPTEDVSRVRGELRERLGAAPDTDQRRGSRLMGRTSRSNASVTTELLWLSTAAAQSDLPALVGWLCSRSCEAPVLVMEPQRGRPRGGAGVRNDPR